MAAVPKLFPRGYENSSRCKLDRFVGTFLQSKCGFSSPESAGSADTAHWTRENVRWYTPGSLPELLKWVNPSEDAAESDQVDVKQAQPIADPIPNSQQESGRISKMHFCEDLYHVREFLNWQLRENYQQCGSDSNGEAIRLEHCLGAEASKQNMSKSSIDINNRDLMPCRWEESKEPKCVLAVASIRYRSRKLIVHFTHNDNPSYCIRNPHYDTNKHAEQRLLDDLKGILLQSSATVADVCIYMLYQPCHYSTDCGDNISCCEFIAKYLKDFKEPPLLLQIKTAFLHKLHWIPKDEETSAQITKAKEGMEILRRSNILVSAMDENDWNNLWRIAVKHT